MADGNGWIEIVLLAMLAAFIGLRLVSVLGKRTGQERPIGDNFRPSAPDVLPPPPRLADRPQRGQVTLPPGTDPVLAPALQALADQDASFHPDRFLNGARQAYRLVLERFWAGDTAALKGLLSDEIAEDFAAAIADRDGQAINGRLLAIDAASITAATQVGQMAEVTVRFTVSISMDGAPAASTVDVWTFSRHIGNADPAWVLIATDGEPGPDSDPA
ncbi:MAG: Tim44/TimA family putative adaptor protein [Sphingomonadales bacterium]